MCQGAQLGYFTPPNKISKTKKWRIVCVCLEFRRTNYDEYKAQTQGYDYQAHPQVCDNLAQT